MIKNGALRLFRVGGVDVYIHWSWIIIFYFFYAGMGQVYSSPLWIVFEVALYILMVALHETVQLITCCMVGGRVSEMYVSFLGRSSNMETPQRPWPIVITYTAGILAYAIMLGGTTALHWNTPTGFGHFNDLQNLTFYLFYMNVILFLWAAVPVYPLDGGRVLHGFLWLVISRKRSLQLACVIGIPVSLAMIAGSIYVAAVRGSYWWVLWTVMIFLQCLNGFRVAKAFDILDKIPRRGDVACPHCRQHPFYGTSIQCSCGESLDPFETRGLCPRCNSSTALLACPLCRQRSPIHQWFGASGGFEVQGITSAAPALSSAVEPVVATEPPPPPAA